MKISVGQITESPKNVSFAESAEELNFIYKEGGVRDFSFPLSLDVNLVYYRSGREIFFQGWIHGTVEGCCSRCLKGYPFLLEKKFDFVLTPEPFWARSGELNRDEMGLSFYSGEEIDLSPFILEQVLLALPMRPLCSAGCRGLCVGCGVDLNEEPCLCGSSQGDPRMVVFRNLKLGQ